MIGSEWNCTALKLSFLCEDSVTTRNFLLNTLHFAVSGPGIIKRITTLLPPAHVVAGRFLHHGIRPPQAKTHSHSQHTPSPYLCVPYIYWLAGDWPSTERLSCRRNISIWKSSTFQKVRDVGKFKLQFWLLALSIMFFYNGVFPFVADARYVCTTGW